MKRYKCKHASKGCTQTFESKLERDLHSAHCDKAPKRTRK